MAAQQRNRVNVFILATCQMLFGATRTLLIATAPLIAYGIVENKGLATLPAALVIVGTALATMPASMLMRATGRRLGFMIGACFGALGGGIVIIGIVRADFWLLCLGTFTYGFFAAFGQYYRFAAADTAPPEFRSKAISLVLTGGVIAAVVGTSLAMAGQFMIPSDEFFGSYLFLIALTLLTVLVLLFLDIPNLTPSERSAQQRPLVAIMKQPIFVVGGQNK